jgi:hypothetical protein
MISSRMVLGVVAASLVLAGCSSASGLLNRGSRGPQATNVPTGGNLSLPPDLQLPAPGSGTAASYQPSAPAASVDGGVYGTPAAAPRRGIGNTSCPNGTKALDIYECYGVNKLKPDGTKKNAAELQLEVRKAVMAEKRRANPSYGTFKNFGELFN